VYIFYYFYEMCWYGVTPEKDSCIFMSSIFNLSTFLEFILLFFTYSPSYLYHSASN